jgi:hypothetical protein
VSDIGRHHGSGRSIRQRNLHERVLHHHCRDTEHIRGDREYCGGGAPRARHDANGEEGNKKEQLQQQQRPGLIAKSRKCSRPDRKGRPSTLTARIFSNRRDRGFAGSSLVLRYV